MATHWTLTDGQRTYLVPENDVPGIQRMLTDIELKGDKPVARFTPIGDTVPVEITLTSATVLVSPTGRFE